MKRVLITLSIIGGLMSSPPILMPHMVGHAAQLTAVSTSENQLLHQPNQYWEMYQQQSLVQPTNAQHAITYQIDPAINQTEQTIWQYAINQYNRLDVIKLVPTTDNPQIQLTDATHYQGSMGTSGTHDLDGNYGITYNNYQMGPSNHAYFTHSVCVLSNHLQSLDDLTLKRDVAEHEIGHALGFAHNNMRVHGKLMVMNSGHDMLDNRKNIPQGLGTYEKVALMLHYYQ